jgi:hypothetical protein
MHFSDLLLAGYAAWGLSRGYRRRIGRELQGLITLLLLLSWLWGFDVARWVRDGFGDMADSLAITQGMIGGLLALIAAFVVMHLLRDTLAKRIEARLSEASARNWGGAAGLLRTTTFGATLIVLLQQLPWLGQGLSDSLTARLLHTIGI